MSTIDVLLRQVEQLSPQLADDLRNEVGALSKLRTFGLNFERHRPESVELPGRPIRRGDKVRIVEDASVPVGVQESQLWRVAKTRRGDKGRSAILTPLESVGDEAGAVSAGLEVPVAALLVVAEFSDPIYPGLRSTGKVERGGDKPFHTVINSENFHALQALLYTHEGTIDAIYIDPPYNTGAKDWKYNNDYVDRDDAYRHSKWLAMMERRLKLAKRLLNPADSFLVVTIDEKEVHRLGLLLDQVFPEARRQMVSVVINSQGSARQRAMSRVDEYAFFVYQGEARPQETSVETLQSEDFQSQVGKERIWFPLIRGGKSGVRSKSYDSFYPIFVDSETGRIIDVGAPLDRSLNPEDYDEDSPPGSTVVWPLSKEGVQGRWQMGVEEFRKRWREGYIRGGKPDRQGRFPITYIRRGTIQRVETGDIRVEGRDSQGALLLSNDPDKPRSRTPKTVWYVRAHNSGTYGTDLVENLLAGRLFPFPKSLYAVEDTLRFLVADKPEAVVLDFFAGSGTTAHAVMRLNRQDGGRRQSISVTNNEVSPDEQTRLRAKGLKPGDAEWEALGISEYITKPRLTSAITGKTPGGELVQGDYKFTERFPISDGFEENAEFFDLTYEAPRAIAYDRNFEAIAPLLWLRAGSEGARIERRDRRPYQLADTYAVLFDISESHEFLGAVEDRGLRVVYIVTDDERAFASIASDLPAEVESVRLYESYLTNFTINTGQEG